MEERREQAIARIREMEAIFDRAEELAAAFDAICGEYLDFQPEIRKLEEYYASPLWKEDFAADEEGELPSDLKRGVLSEDGIYNLLEKNKEILEQLC